MYPISSEYETTNYYTKIVAADSRRKEFDIKNHTLIHSGLKPELLFVGDSITHYWELNAYFRSMKALVVNRGIGGDTTEYLRKRFYADVVQLRPQYCIMAIGINDSLDLEEDYWKLIKGLDYVEVIERTKKNLREIIHMAETEGIRMLIGSLPAVDLPISSCEQLRKQFILEINQELQELCRKKDMIYLDYYSAMCDETGMTVRNGLTYDGLHPNAYGYDIMADVLKSVLKENKIYIEKEW